MRQSAHDENAASRPPGADADSLLQGSPAVTATILVVEDEVVVGC